MFSRNSRSWRGAALSTAIAEAFPISSLPDPIEESSLTLEASKEHILTIYGESGDSPIAECQWVITAGADALPDDEWESVNWFGRPIPLSIPLTLAPGQGLTLVINLEAEDGMTTRGIIHAAGVNTRREAGFQVLAADGWYRLGWVEKVGGSRLIWCSRS